MSFVMRRKESQEDKKNSHEVWHWEVFRVQQLRIVETQDGSHLDSERLCWCFEWWSEHANVYVSKGDDLHDQQSKECDNYMSRWKGT